MATSVPTNPFLTSSAAGTFYSSSDGYVQGLFRDDPAVRFYLAGGILSQSETLPMWGGVLIYEQIPTPYAAANPTPSLALGSIVGRATTQTQTSATGAAGFSVFNQNYANIIDPGASNVPLTPWGGLVNYFRFGSGARIPVACDPSLASLEAGSTAQQVSWDFNNQRLQPYDASTATYAISTATWASTNGGQLTIAMSSALPFTPSPGDVLTISGATNTGSGGATVINTSFTVYSGASTSSFVLTAPAASGVFGTIGGSPVIDLGTGALPVKVLRVVTAGNMTVSWNPLLSTATWNYNGPVAEILI